MCVGSIPTLHHASHLENLSMTTQYMPRMIVKLIIKPCLDFQTLVNLCMEVTGKNPIKDNVQNREFVNDVEDIPRVMKNIFEHIDNSFKSLKHQTYGFLVYVVDTRFFIKLVSTSNMRLSIKDQLAIVSGDLSDWRDFIIEQSIEQTDYDLRLFANMCMEQFNNLGLSYVWQEYGRRQLADQTFKLVEK
jgi:hypothetical protein